MRRVTFKLQAINGGHIIQLNFNHENGRFRKSTGIKCTPDQFSKVKMRLNDKNPHHFEINKMLESWSQKIIDAYFKCKAEEIPITDYVLKHALENTLSNKKSSKNFYGFLDEFIESRRNGSFKGSTIKNYIVFRNNINRFLPKVNWSDINYSLYEKYDHDMRVIGKLNDNTRAKFLSILRTVCNLAVKKGFYINPNYKDFKIKEKPVYNIYLSLSELELLHNTNYSGENIQNAVDLFLIGCYTGLRFIDFNQILPENIRTERGVELLYINDTKTGMDLVIPIHQVVKNIIKKNSGLPKPIAQQTLNEKIKIACREAGITKKVVYYYNNAGKIKSEIVSKWELVTTHTARRSFATNMHILGVNHKLIMSITGHTTESNFMKYIKVDKEDTAILLAKTEFFK